MRAFLIVGTFISTLIYAQNIPILEKSKSFTSGHEKSLKTEIANHPHLMSAVSSGFPVTASSFWHDETKPNKAKLYDPDEKYAVDEAWSADFSDVEPWIQVNMVRPKLVEYVAI